MANDTLSIAGVTFDGFSTPDAIGSGGKQAMVIHKLPGGSRVINTLGPDEDDISWSGKFFGDSALDNALVLDGIRIAGSVVPLTFAGQYRSVIVSHFVYKIRRYPVWVEYEITCVVYQNPALGNLSVSLGGLDAMIMSDLSFAVSLLP